MNRQSAISPKYCSNPVGFALDYPAGDVPDDVRRRAAFLLLDTLGVAAAALATKPCRVAFDTAANIYGAASTEYQATIIFDGRTASIPGAAFAAATTIDNVDAHDGFNPAKGHIGVAVVPALIAVSEKFPALSGNDALAALAISYEIAGRAGLSLHGTVTDYHTSGAWNALGVAALGARLRGASAEVLRHALGIAEFHGPRSQMMREIAHPTMLHDGSGMGAFVGLSSLIMAEMGFEGAPAITMDADDVGHYWSDLGSRWITREQYIKMYPVCRWAHAAIDGARMLRDKHTFAPEEIVSIRIGSFKNATCLFPGHPTTTSEAQYSLPFAVAKMLVHGRVGVSEIQGEALRDPVAGRLIDITEMVVEDRHEARFPETRRADLTLTLASGEMLTTGDLEALGGPDNPFTEDEISEKFIEYAAPGLGLERTIKIRDAVLELLSPGTKFASLGDLLKMPPVKN